MIKLMAMAFVIFAFLSFNSVYAKPTNSVHAKHKNSVHVKHTKNNNNPGANSNSFINYGNNLIYDSGLDVTWYNPNVGNMTWTQATSWIKSLNDPTSPLGDVMGWRLPFIINGVGDNPMSTLDIAFSEMEQLYLELGNLPGGPLTNTGPFAHLESLNYWSSADYPRAITLRAFAFNFGNDKYGYGNKIDGTSFAVLAVHSGNIGATQIPEPDILLLLGPGLAGLVVMRKRIIQSLSHRVIESKRL